MPNQFRAEMHERILAPIYPFAFAALTFAFLGMPRTTRQSRNFSMAGAIAAVFVIRLAGFACSIMTNGNLWFAALQYLLLATAIGLGVWVAARHIVIEPPARLMEWISALTASIARRRVRAMPS
jgi:lipopolysaccharide export system permease protein